MRAKSNLCLFPPRFFFVSIVIYTHSAEFRELRASELWHTTVCVCVRVCVCVWVFVCVWEVCVCVFASVLTLGLSVAAGCLPATFSYLCFPDISLAYVTYYRVLWRPVPIRGYSTLKESIAFLSTLLIYFRIACASEILHGRWGSENRHACMHRHMLCVYIHIYIYMHIHTCNI